MPEEPVTVLIIEDSPVQAQAMGLTLEGHGLQVKYARDGMVGVGMAELCRPQAIIMDVEMPHMNGIIACQQLKANPKTADIPVIMLTAYSRLNTMERSLAEGAVDFIPKDAFAMAVLVETLRQLNVIRDSGKIASTNA